MKYLVLNDHKEVVFNTLTHFDLQSVLDFTIPSEKFKCGKEQKLKRRGIIKLEGGKLYAETDNRLLVKNNSLFIEHLISTARILSQFLAILNDHEEANNRIVNRLLHNVVRLNGSTLQRLYSTFPEETLTGDLDKQFETISEIIRNKNIDVTKLIFSLIKNSLFIRTEFSAFKALYTPSNEIERQKFSLRKVVLQVLHIFFYDFSQKDIYVYVENFSQKTNLNYPSITAALVHLIDNAAKYSCPNTRLEIQFREELYSKLLIFDMISLKITDNDYEKMHDEGYSGEFPEKLDLSGDGIGLSVIPTLLRLNNANLIVNRNVDQSKSQYVDNVPYENNQFVIKFN